MIGIIFLFVVGSIFGWRRGVIDSKAAGAILAFGLFMGVVAATGNLAYKPWLRTPGLLQWLLVFLSYIVPAGAGYAVGVALKRKRLENDREFDGEA